VGYAVAVPNNAESFTSATLLTETDQGEAVANGYPETLDESEQFVLRLANHEGESRSYTVVAELQRVESADGSQRVAQRDEVVRTSTTVADGATWTHPHMVQPTVAGDDVRLIYYVYRGEAPSEPSVQSADRYVHVWLTVRPARSSDGSFPTPSSARVRRLPVRGSYRSLDGVSGEAPLDAVSPTRPGTRSVGCPYFLQAHATEGESGLNRPITEKYRCRMTTDAISSYSRARGGGLRRPRSPRRSSRPRCRRWR